MKAPRILPVSLSARLGSRQGNFGRAYKASAILIDQGVALVALASEKGNQIAMQGAARKLSECERRFIGAEIEQLTHLGQTQALSLP